MASKKTNFVGVDKLTYRAAALKAGADDEFLRNVDPGLLEYVFDSFLNSFVARTLYETRDGKLKDPVNIIPVSERGNSFTLACMALAVEYHAINKAAGKDVEQGYTGLLYAVRTIAMNALREQNFPVDQLNDFKSPKGPGGAWENIRPR